MSTKRFIGALAASAILALSICGSATAKPKLSPIAVNTANWLAKAGFGSSAPAWYKDASGIVHLQGAAKQTSPTGSKANVLGTLPPAARPTRAVYTIVHTFAGTYADLGIGANGTIGLIGPRPPAVNDLSFVSLEGISYQRTNVLPASAIPLNAANWTGSAGFSSIRPEWYKSLDGVVHLEGAAKQTSGGGLSPNLLGTLPPAARPPVNTFTVVHTFAGTYADIGINADGTINLVGPRPPAVKDFSFVSLEGITYQQNQFRQGGFLINSANWGFAGFGAQSPGWYKDGSGIVHLVGALKQTSSTGDPNLFGTLPNIASPTRTVYTIVHTFFGTYADLSIAPNGQIRVLAPRPPAVEDLSFLSLEGITYQQ